MLSCKSTNHFFLSIYFSSSYLCSLFYSLSLSLPQTHFWLYFCSTSLSLYSSHSLSLSLSLFIYSSLSLCFVLFSLSLSQSLCFVLSLSITLLTLLFFYLPLFFFKSLSALSLWINSFISFANDISPLILSPFVCVHLFFFSLSLCMFTDTFLKPNFT